MTVSSLYRHLASPFLAIAISLAPHAALADDLTVSAAASLTNAFNDIGKDFEAKHAGSHVVFNFAASDVLLKQIGEGAPADVFASADEVTMDRAVATDRVEPKTRRDFAANTLVLIVPAGSAVPGALGDLKADRFKHVAIGNPALVPAGRYARMALADAGLWDALQPRLVEAQNVRQALDYVARAEAEAGFVYATDAATQKEKVTVALTIPTSTPVRYPIAAVKGSPHAPLASEFVDFVLSAPSQATLQKYGFTPIKP
jgi:molybdate transport system substrate-binding protein